MVNEVIADRYEIRELVGTGGMSSVYLAYDRLLERKVALKILHDELGRDGGYVDRFRREARAVAQLSHPNIVTVIDRGEQGGRQFIVFEYVDGENLKDLVAREGPLPVRDAIELVLQVARGLAFAHQHGLVHRDVKPHNVLLDDAGRARVTDFGVARSLDVDLDDGTTAAGVIFGTSHYIAPEQAHAEPTDERTDVYSLGAVLYELLTGDVPYPGEGFVAVALRHVNDPVPSVREKRFDVPERVDAVVERAMAKDPADRYESMGAFCAELEACLDHLHADGGATAIIAPGTGAAASPAPRRRRRWLLLVVPLLLLALAGAGVAAYFVTRDSDGTTGGKTRKVLKQVRVRVSAVTAYDPDGDKSEHDSDAPSATDGDPLTSWSTEHYQSGLAKRGVGLVLDAGKKILLSELDLTTDTPGFVGQLRAGNSEEGPFNQLIVPSGGFGSRTVLDPEGRKTRPARYYLIWITDLSGNAAVHINEITRALEAKP